MYAKKLICVVVPAFNEENLIRRVIDTMPVYVDSIIVVDDKSRDSTVKKVEKIIKQKKHGRVKLIRLSKNSGVGVAIVRGYRQAVEDGMEIVAVMAGDAQMDPNDLKNIIGPVARGEADYVKGNRLYTGEAWKIIPKHRYLGNAFLSLLTKMSSGYWHLADSQTGFTAISATAIKLLPLYKLYPRYGYPNHLLAMLNVYSQRVKDVPIRPVYNIGEKSGIRLWQVIPALSWLLFKNFIWRMWQKYIIRDFHPLIFFYALAFMLLGASIPLGLRIILIWRDTGNIPPINALAVMFTLITGVQSLFFAMWFDMENNKGIR
ncbi:MAG: glycosyltransferase family 2 protein [Anaerolineales bacterium]